MPASDASDAPTASAAPQPVLVVRDLALHYFTSKGVVRALDGVSFTLGAGETLGLVGESGCGKTTTGVALLNMPSPPGRIVEGSIVLDGIEIVGMKEKDLRRQVRWSRISMVFQGAMNCLTPVYTIRALMRETMRQHAGPKPLEQADEEKLMRLYVGLVGLPEHVLGRYPHELSGGMKQRVVIAMALFLEPKVVVMDEPTTALDVIVQAQILNLVKELKRRLNLSYVFITHDLATEAEVADRIMVMYAGKIAEIGTNAQVFGERGPLHPYTQRLLAATPRLHRKVSELAFIPGAPPDLIDPPPGCRFSPRCAFAREKCRRQEPPLTMLEAGHTAACWKAMEDADYARS
jgi:peptide/nickel transport system ATP-binding protein